MEFGKHLGKGLWGIADKSLPVAYGLGYVLLVIRVLPEREFGNFVLVQEFFLIISGLGTAFALQPMLKFASEENARLEGILSAGIVLNFAFTVFLCLPVLLLRGLIGDWMQSTLLASLLLYLPGMLAASFIRNFTLMLLQSRFMIREVFWTDALHFLGAPLLTWIYSRMHLFDSARDLLQINIISLSLSSAAGLYAARRFLTFRFPLRTEEMRRVWNYGKYSAGTVASYLIYSRSDSFIVSAFGGPVHVAIYNAAKIFGRLYEMANQVIQMFVLPAASRISSQNAPRSLQSLTEKAILFGTVAMLPIFLIFLIGSPVLVQILYSGRYIDAVPVLRVFSLLAFLVPLLAVGSNVLLGIGETRASFSLGVQMLLVSLVAYVLFTGLLGPLGAAIGAVVASLILAWFTLRTVNRFIRLAPLAVLDRVHDITAFLKSRLKV